MARLPQYFLEKDKARGDWTLTRQGASRVSKRFGTKAEATKGGALSAAVGKAGGSVRIKKENGRIQEERTFPRSRDPKRSPG